MAIPKEEMSKFNKFLRESRIPSSRDMSDRAIQVYERQNGEITPELLRNDFSDIISECIQIENRMFFEIMNDVRESWMEDLLGCEDRKGLFPTISRLADRATDSLNSETTVREKLADVTRILHEINDGVSFGQKQSGKTRAGTAFQNYLESFFGILGFEYERQKRLTSGEILDLIFPSLEMLEQRHSDCIMMECQTTLKDRFRLSLGKGQDLEGIARFIATLTGANVITESDHRDLSPEKIGEIRDKNWRLVALKKVADRVNSPAIISFEEFVNTQYPSRSGLW